MKQRVFEIARFLIAGGVAAAANWSSRFAFSVYFRYEIAVVFAFLVGLTTGFLLMRGWVFLGHRSGVARQASMYFLVNLFALAQTLIISVALARWALPALGIDRGVEGIAHLVGVLMPVFTSYILHKRATFK